MKRVSLIITFFFILITAACSQSLWSVELHGGEVFNMPLPLSLSQKGYPGINLKARFHTEAFTPPVYWDCRVGRWSNHKSWEIEVIHHKLYLDNLTNEVQKFNISHGFNLLMINRGFDKEKFRTRYGVGIVLAHPESKIRGMEFGNTTNDLDLGYFISGPVINFAIGKPVRISNRLYFDAEAKTTLAYAHIKIASGHAEVFNLAFHLILGLGVNL